MAVLATQAAPHAVLHTSSKFCCVPIVGGEGSRSAHITITRVVSCPATVSWSREHRCVSAWLQRKTHCVRALVTGSFVW